MIAILEKVIELAAIAGKVLSGIEDWTERFLSQGNSAAYCELPAEAFANIRGRRKVIRVHMRFKYPLAV